MVATVREREEESERGRVGVTFVNVAANVVASVSRLSSACLPSACLPVSRLPCVVCRLAFALVVVSPSGEDKVQHECVSVAAVVAVVPHKLRLVLCLCVNVHMLLWFMLPVSVPLPVSLFSTHFMSHRSLHNAYKR